MFSGLPGVLFVLPDSYVDQENKDYGGEFNVNSVVCVCFYTIYVSKFSVCSVLCHNRSRLLSLELEFDFSSIRH